MSFKPAHKDTTNPPGQIVNPIDRSKTIGGIIDRVMRSEAQPIKKKLTFDEWWAQWPAHSDMGMKSREYAYQVWKAAQENV
jgi:hypothetical protein